ncbi:MAG: DUF1385 domain-containing protein [Thermodesulfovibrionales bacterium]
MRVSSTSFLLIVMVISIVVFSFIPQGWSFAGKALPPYPDPGHRGDFLRAAPFLREVAGHPLVGAMVLPGLLLQRLTVREPDNAQIEGRPYRDE